MNQEPAQKSLPRLLEPIRDGQRFVVELRDDLLSRAHPARLFWELFGVLDLSPFLANAKSVEGNAGRSILSPRLLLTLWSYAFTEGITSAREIEEKTKRDLYFKWIVGNLEISHNKLSTFLVENFEAFNALLTSLLLLMKKETLFSTKIVSQDGVRILANASESSFRSKETLEQWKDQAELHLKAVMNAPQEGGSIKSQKGQLVGAWEMLQRAGQALEVVEELQKKKKKVTTRIDKQKKQNHQRQILKQG